ncbi:hypothetical protein DFQ04_0703 [Algoriphagus boseongensis]|uniref:Uncharacterized protein n=1 Tax=Algoriphagus boseongensis TaxID=1442587 RepID=A0A4R6TAB9_9BACT|nr:immunoglobulin domain-containing protein [Algoriphagus boseongensis]TDQ18892.1 hypothetical protein DFQ04_0703 [Algoriphagus boseongensis]
MKIQKNWISSSFGKANSLLVRSFLFLFFCFLLPGCQFLETKVKEFLLEFNAADGTMNQVIVDGTLFIDGVTTDVTTKDILDLSVSDKEIFITMEFGNDIYFLAVPSVEKTYDLFDEYEGQVMAFTGGGYRTLGGIGNLSNFSVEATDTYEGSGSFGVTAVGEIQLTTGGAIKQFSLQMNFDFDTSRTGGIAGGGGSTGGGSGSTGGTGGSGGTGTCVNEIKAPKLVAYWDQIKPVALATGTGKRIAANQVFSDLKASDVGLFIDATSGGTRYVVQILFTSANLVANKTINFQNGGAGAGLTNAGAIGILYAKNGSVSDDWRTNRDFGKNKNMGTLTIKTVTPKITGTYSFKASGDGYPSLNNQYAEVSGSFCIDP